MDDILISLPAELSVFEPVTCSVANTVLLNGVLPWTGRALSSGLSTVLVSRLESLERQLLKWEITDGSEPLIQWRMIQCGKSRTTSRLAVSSNSWFT